MLRTRTARVVAALAAAVIAAPVGQMLAETARASTPVVHPPLPPAHGVALGAFTEIGGKSPRQAVQARTRQLHRRYAIESHYYNWKDPFPGTLERQAIADGAVPMITWWGTGLRAIVNGSQDANIRAHAAAVRAFRHPVLIRWGAEMNGNWFAWSGPRNGNNPALFVAAWRHIHDIFVMSGVRNAAWVWCPNADSSPGGTSHASRNNWRAYYPGSRYVDWVGIDGYNWGRKFTWQSFGSIFTPVYADYASTKPIMIGETSSVEAGGSKAAWIAGAARWIEHHPRVKALVWFDTRLSATRIDWRIDSSAASLNAFRSVATTPYFEQRLR